MGQESLTAEFGAGIAIVGMGCILPGGVDSYTGLWKFLCEGRQGISEIPADRWNNDVVFHPDPNTPGKTVTRNAGFVSDIAGFDPGFFGISPREAAVMDPQQRMLLETAWRALEDAGVQIEKLSGSRTGVYIGISHSDYHGIQKHAPLDIDVHTSTGGALSIAANRLSHRFNLRGPSLSVDTACSSSLVALDIACSALRTGECEMAIVGGVNAILTPEVTITFSRASMLSPDGRCKAFDARANGYVRGEGASMVVLKPIARALADRDRIHAVIRATAVNQDGHTSTITVPSMQAQIEMLQEACRRASIDPSHVGYVEAHGTGTPVGDPIEAQAIGRVFGKPHSDVGPCIVGSIKTNIGHLEPAAGVTGLIKAALCVKHGMIPPHLNFETPNPNIAFDELGIEVCRGLRPFPARALRRTAAVNSFGFGGTNACAVVQEPPTLVSKRASADNSGWPVLLPLSAANRGALEAMAGDLAEALPQASLVDAAGTLAMRRSHLEHRMAVIATSREQAIDSLKSFAAKAPHNHVVSGRRRTEPRIAFVFTGQGAHWWAMGRGLLQKDAVFRQTIEECDEHFRALSGFSIISELLASRDRSRLDKTIVAQPATFALQLGLAARWKAWGIEPGAVVGHSIGEMAASHICGALSLKDAVRVVHHRSRLQEQTRLQGGMAAIGLSANATRSLLDDLGFDIEIAAVNAPELVTVAGVRNEVQRLIAELATSRQDVFTRLLNVDYAFHSRQMDPFEAELRANLQGIVSRRPDIPMYSTVTGVEIEPEELSDGYWWRNMRYPVLFKDAVEPMIDAGFNTFVELGAHPALAAPLRSCLAHRGHDGTVVASLHREVPDQEAMIKGLAELHVSGVPVNWDSVIPGAWNFIDLPGQRFEKSRYWTDSEESRAARFDSPVHPLLGTRLKTAKPTWQSTLSGEMPRYLGDHEVDGTVLFPAAGFVELMLAAGKELLGEMPIEMEDILFHEALVLAPNTIVFVQTSADPTRGTIEVRSRVRGREGSWELRASSRVRAWSGPEPKLGCWQPKIAPPAHFKNTRFYRQLRAEGHNFGPAFQGVDTIWRERGVVLGEVSIPSAAGSPAGYLLHPSLLDSCFQVIRGFRDLSDFEGSDATLALPIGITRLRFYREPGTKVFSRAVAVADEQSEIAADISIIDEKGAVVATISSFRCRRVVRPKAVQTHTGAAAYQESWQALPLPEPSAAADAAPLQEQGCWLILSDRGGAGAALAQALRAKGIASVLAFAGPQLRKLDDGTFECPPDAAAGFKDAIAACGTAISHIVHMWALDEDDGAITPASLRAAQQRGTEALIAVTAAANQQEARPKIVIVTAGAVAVGGGGVRSEAAALQRASLVGAMRSIANEFPDMRPQIVDLDPAAPSVDTLLNEILSDESEVAVRGDQRYGCRLDSVSDESISLRRQPWNRETRTPMFRLTMTAPGVIDDLVIREMPAPEIRDGEVLIEVHAVGLNFRDVMAATGLLPAEAEAEPAWQNLGFECAGVVRAVGGGVDRSLIGARVVAVARGSFASHVCANAALAFRLPDSLSFAEAAALPTAYTTAQYSLVTAGRIRPGDRVLIHVATGGVGLAAVSVARKHGAQIIATAGSEEKRAYLRQLGIEHVFDSRSLSFADDVLAATDGYGVDIVLNSLPGAFLEKGLSLLAPGGRFLEIGKRDIYSDSLIGLRSLRRNAAFFAIDLAQLAQDQPAILRRELESIISDLACGKLDKLPVVEFGMANAADAFRHMARARHIGKVVVTCGDEPLMVETNANSGAVIRPDAAYLVTGGLAGFGLATARWLIEQGARHLVLVGRSGVTRDGGDTVLAEMRAAGAQVTTLTADLTSFDDVRRVFDEIKTLSVPLRGIFHAAGVIDDALVLQLTVDQIRRVFEPKILGAWHLHEAARDIPLDLFICFSSVAAHLGSVGQAHYAGANAALEAFSEMRHRQGRPCLAVAWGAIGDVGFLARNADVARYLQHTGVATIPVQDALAALGKWIASDSETIVFADVDWAALARANPAIASSPRTAALAHTNAHEAHQGQHLRSRVAGLPQPTRVAIVTRFIQEQIATVLKVSPDTIELQRPLSELGLDSLTSFELKSRIEAELGASLAIGAFLQKPTVHDLAGVILEKIDSSGVETSEAGAAATAASDPILSAGQEALWYVERLAPDSPGYGLAMAMSVSGRIDEEVFDKAYQYVVARHECLRLAFPADANGLLPIALPVDAFKTQVHDATSWDEATLREALDRNANKPFDLAAGPLIQIHLYRRTDATILLMHVHQLVADASSVTIVIQQILEAYLALRADLPVRWSRPAPSYFAYAAAQRRMLESQAGSRHLAFWRKELAGAPATIPLPTDLPRPPRQRGTGASFNLAMPASLGRQLARVAQEHGTTLFTVLFGAFNVLMHRLSGNDDVVIGLPTGGRTRSELEDCVGHLVNVLPIRTRFQDRMSFSRLFTRIDETVRAALEHEEFPFARIASGLNLPRDPAHSPVFQVMFAMERAAVIDSHGLSVALPPHTPVAAPHWGIREFKIEVVPLKRDRTQFDLSLIVEEVEDQIYGVVDYRADLWAPSTIEAFVQQYREILLELAGSADGLIDEAAARRPVQPALAGPRLAQAVDVVTAVRAAAAGQPDRVAIEAIDDTCSYGKLLARADALTAGLSAHGIGPQSIVGLCLARTSNLPVAMLAVMQTGAAFVMLDPALPREQLAGLIAAVQPGLIIADEGLAAAIAVQPACPIRTPAELSRAPVGGRVPDARGELAYLATGSSAAATVEIFRQSLSNVLAALAQELPVGPDNVWLATAPVSDDLAILELLLPLTLGGSVVVADERMARDGDRLAGRLAKGDVTVMQASPATWQAVLKAGWRGDRAFAALVGRERLPADLAADLLERVGTLWSLFGSAETTICSTCAQVLPGCETVPLGRPIASTTCLIVDRNLNAVPAGSIGELLVAGAGLARGYRNDPQRTAERFVSLRGAMGEDRYFRTGMFARIDHNGEIVSVGRRDALPLAADGRHTPAAPAAAPRNRTEETLLAIVKDVLEQPAIGVDDDFFDVGGNSLQAMRYLARIGDVLQVDLGPHQLLIAPSVAALAALIERTNGQPTSAAADAGLQTVLASSWRPLAVARAEGVIPAPEAAAIVPLPDDIVRADLAAPSWTGLCNLPLGNVALVLAGVRRKDLLSGTASQAINEAVAYASGLGARSISVDGPLPAATGAAAPEVALTTGHAATAAAVCLTIQSAMTQCALEFSGAKVCLIGTGAAGSAALHMMLQRLGHPRGLVLCGNSAQGEVAESLAREAKLVHGFGGSIDIVEATDRLPDAPYKADLLVVTGDLAIDVDRLRPGSIVVDGSLARSFDMASAMRRLTQAGDVLFVDGNAVRPNGPIQWTYALPGDMPATDRALLSRTVLPANDWVPASMLAPLLSQSAGVTPASDQITPEPCREHWDAFEKLGIAVPPLHCGSWMPADADLERFRSVLAKARKGRARGSQHVSSRRG